MSQIIQIIEMEQQRAEDNRAVIHLHKDGAFWRAYNWSAWLCHRFVKEFKVIHKSTKNIEESFLYVGFPVTSFENHFGGLEKWDADEKTMDVFLPSSIVPDSMTVEIMTTDYTAWKESQPITESKVKQKSDVKSEYAPLSAVNGKTPMTVTAIMQNILSFPLEQNSPLQCMMFLAETKQQLARLI